MGMLSSVLMTAFQPIVEYRVLTYKTHTSMACTSDDDLIAFTLACSVGCHFCFIYAFCIYLRILVSNTISKSDDARVV